MFVSQLCHHGDGTKSCVLSKCVRDYFQGFSESFEAVCLLSEQGFGVVHQLDAGLDFGCTSTSNQCALLDETADHTERIMNRTISFLHNKLVRSANEKTHSFTWI